MSFALPVTNRFVFLARNQLVFFLKSVDEPKDFSYAHVVRKELRKITNLYAALGRLRDTKLPVKPKE